MLKISLTALIFLLSPMRGYADAPHVATDIAPIHSLVSMVMQGVGEPDLILPPGASAHHYAMRPSEAAMLDRAEVVFWIGPDLTPWLESAIQNLAADANVVTLATQPGALILPAREGADLKGTIPGSIDEHMWLDPENAKLWLATIAATLSQADPDNSDPYARNLETAIAGIDLVVSDITNSPAPKSAFISLHDSYQYFENAFDRQAVGAFLPHDDAKLTPSRMAALQKLVMDEDVFCLLAAPGADTSLADILLPNGLYTIRIDPIGANLPLGPDLYPDLLRGLNQAIVDCQ